LVRDPGKKGDAETVTRSAEEPGQTLNVDLCFVPAQHTAAAKLPAVSGSSCRLVVEPPVAAGPPFPGQVFADPEQDYAAAMVAYVAASQPVAPSAPTAGAAAAPVAATLKAQKQALRRTEEQLRTARRQVREQRRQQDAAWAAARQQHRADCSAVPDWPQVREQRRHQQVLRQQEDAQWREQRTQLHAQWAQVPIVTAWIAILVLTDNCTRQCLGLPLFVAGAHVTSDLIVAALRTLLPTALQFLISDRGVHFTAQLFAQFAQEQEFIHVLIARHRPQSNGIAERFVRTLKEWLAEHDWQTAEQLLALLAQCRTDYNDRPHQGLPIPGLSPNEFAKRIWLF
jgi:transposase InsO family protein